MTNLLRNLILLSILLANFLLVVGQAVATESINTIEPKFMPLLPRTGQNSAHPQNLNLNPKELKFFPLTKSNTSFSLHREAKNIQESAMPLTNNNIGNNKVEKSKMSEAQAQQILSIFAESK